MKRFFTDSASFGSKIAIKGALEFFGNEKVMFAMDMPFGPGDGLGQLRNTLKAIEIVNLQKEDWRRLFPENVRKLIKI